MYGTLISFLWILIVEVLARKFGLGDRDGLVATAAYVAGLTALLYDMWVSRDHIDGGAERVIDMGVIGMLTGVYLGYLLAEPGSFQSAMLTLVLVAVIGFMTGFALWSYNYVNGRARREQLWQFSLGVMAAQTSSCAGFMLFGAGFYQGEDWKAAAAATALVLATIAVVRALALWFDRIAQRMHDRREGTVNQHATDLKV